MNTSNVAIGQRLIEVREARGLQQAAMARMLNLSAQRYGGYERGRTIPSPDVLLKIWQMTGGTSDFVLFGRMDGMAHELVSLILARRERGQSDAEKSA